MRLQLLFPAVLTVCFTWACSGNATETSSATDTIADSVLTLPADSVIHDNEPIQAADSVLTDEITDADEAIAFMNASPDSAKYAEGILHKMATDNVDYTARLLKNRFNHFIVVDKQSMHVVLFDRFGRTVKAFKMACARNYGTKHRKNDCRTPEGFFEAGKTYDATDWLYTNERGYTSPTRGVYGPRFIRIVNPATNSVGIHGTNAPGSLGHRASHGCVRVHNTSILELVKYAKEGMPLIVNPSDRDQQVNRKEGYNVVKINIGSSFKDSAFSEPDPITIEKQRPDSVPDSATRIMADTVAKTAPKPEISVPATPAEPATEPAGSENGPGNAI